MAKSDKYKKGQAMDMMPKKMPPMPKKMPKSMNDLMKGHKAKM